MSLVVSPPTPSPVQNQWGTLSGNTASASTYAGSNIVFVGGSNITLAASSDSIFFHGGAGGTGGTTITGADGGVGISAGASSLSTGTIVLSNSHGVSFGLSGSTLTASVRTDYQSSGAYLTTAQPPGAYLTTAQPPGYYLTTAQPPGAYLTTAQPVGAYLTTAMGSNAGSLFMSTSERANYQSTAGVAEPVIIVGNQRWPNTYNAVNLTADAVKEASSVTVSSTAGLSAGQLVLLDELSNAAWQTDPQSNPAPGGHGYRQVWASSDYRVVWQMHYPYVAIIDDCDGSTAGGPYSGSPGTLPEAMGWFSRFNRPTSEFKKIDHISGSTVYFTTPIHISYRTGAAHLAQIAYQNYDQVIGAGIEGLTASGGDDGCIRFVFAEKCWAKNVEVTTWRGEGFAIDASYMIEVRDSYIHDAAYSVPGGGAYAISIQGGSAEALIENNISVRVNKVMVDRASGAGSVIAYNYTDDGFIDYAPNWQEMGIGASHMVGAHHVLLEGNWSFNGDNDHTHGNSIYHTYFRNYLTGYRTAFTSNTGIHIDDFNNLPAGNTNGPLRSAGPSAFSYWMSYVGNVLGTPGHVSGWTYADSNGDKTIWPLGWENHADLFNADATTESTLLRDGNYDYVTTAQHWHGIGGADGSGTPDTIPSSLYLSDKPAFFKSTDAWPWVDPAGSTKVYTLPAKRRFDAGTPNDTSTDTTIGVIGYYM